MLDKTKMREKLIELMARSDAREWAEGKSLEEVWSECPRGDWMLWLAKRAGVDKRTITLAQGRCAELVKHLMKDARSITAVEVSISYGLGNSTDEELAAAAAAYAYADAAADAARNKMRKMTADAVRAVITVEMLKL